MMHEKAEDQISLLREESEPLDFPLRSPTSPSRRIYGIVIHALLGVFVLTTGVVGYRYYKLLQAQPQLFSPVNDILKYDTHAFYDNIFEISPYQGTPTDEKDEMWLDLYRDTRNTEISAADAAKLPNSTVLLAETGRSSGIVSLEVFHQLHCLDALRKTMYPDRYPKEAIRYPNGTVNPERLRHHEHCVDRIRQGIQCASDVGTIFWQWKEWAKGWQLSMKTTHSCRNFDDISKWAKARENPTWDFTVRPE